MARSPAEDIDKTIDKTLEQKVVAVYAISISLVKRGNRAQTISVPKREMVIVGLLVQ